MLVYRIEREKHLRTVLEGVGASLSDGCRWNSLNTRMVYTSESRALATLEVVMHLDLTEDMPTDRYYVEIEIEDDLPILELRLSDLPESWDVKPPGSITQYIGDDFVAQAGAAILKVPSSIVPQEANYLINPLHQDKSRIRVLRSYPMRFDGRLKK
jgi:RES domain-containing protein